MENNGIDVAYVAQLARLEIPAEAMGKLQQDMAAIVGYIAELNDVDVSGVEATAHAAPMDNVWREDCAGEPFERSVMLKNAPALVDDELIKVPQVLPGEGMN